MVPLMLNIVEQCGALKCPGWSNVAQCKRGAPRLPVERIVGGLVGIKALSCDIWTAQDENVDHDPEIASFKVFTFSQQTRIMSHFCQIKLIQNTYLECTASPGPSQTILYRQIHRDISA